MSDADAGRTLRLSGDWPDPDRSGPERVLRLGQALLVVLAAFVAASAVTPPVLEGLVGAGLLDPEGVVHTLARTVVQFAGFALAVAGYLLASGDRDLLSVRRPSRTEAALAVGGVGVLLVGQFGLLAVLSAVGIDVGRNQAVTTGEGRPTYYLLMIPISLLVVGPVEELLFRGGVQGLLRRAYGPRGAVALATVVFGLVHYPAVVGTPAERLSNLLVVVVLGAVLGVLYERSRNLVVPAVAHGGYNAVLFALQYAGAVGVTG